MRLSKRSYFDLKPKKKMIFDGVILTVKCLLYVSENLALHQPAWLSGTYRSYTGAERAVDGRYRWGEDSVRYQTGENQQQSGGCI